MAINPSPAALSMGTLVNERFRVKKLLGYGGYGNVYLVEDELVFPGNQFALKESLSSTISEQRQFTREAKWLMSLEHPNLPRVAEQFEWNGRPYFVMAYVAGENLEDRVDRMGPLPEDQVLAWMLPICDAVAYLHEQKKPIIHRDIKPGNIIVSKDGRPWLVDFGIAKQVHAGSRKTTRAARAVSGGYSPLEQYTRGGTDVRSDIYALGATFYHLLTGICPPEAPDIASGVARLPNVRQVHSRVSRQAELVVMRAMSQKPEDRYQSVRALMTDLPGGRTFRITANGTVAQPVAAAASSKRNSKGAKGAKGAAAPAQPVPAASQATAVGVPAPVAPAPPPFLPAQAPAATFIGPPQASVLQYGAPPAWAAQQPAVAAATPPAAQPMLPAAKDAQGAKPQPPPAVPPDASQQAPGRHRRVVLPGLVALVSGLAVLATMILTVLYLEGNQQQAPVFVLAYGDVVAKQDVGLDVLLTLIPVAALRLVVLPIANWLKRLGRGWTYLLVLLVSLAGLVPVVVWIASGQADAVDSLFGRGFFVPSLFFLVTWVISLVWFVRRR
ncbi:MAG TPA: serine/threonine-protein kinase [Ktedonobacterales bacterium]|nr:serine/threonine-protein kinase [Ktedonobacterales bacterium]